MQNKDLNEEGKPKFQSLEINYTNYKTILTSKYENRKPWEKPDEKKFLSVLPGTILKVDIKKGDKIKNGQVVMMFEAMKMINTVKASLSGVVKNVYVKVGDKVPKNFLMFELE
ncbi:MAG TPA: acetyl-CoA carboxylase biotin carboxyl carrier protein subunit [Bacteroidales bacterium]